jgi:hypothetical protein
MKNSIILLLLMVSISCPLFANDAAPFFDKSVSISGIGVGTIIAIVASWSRNKSILWAIFHAFCGWFYVIYYVITR